MTSANSTVSASCSLVVLVGVSGSGKSTFARAALPADRGDLAATSAAGWSPTTRTTRRPPTDAFEVLHYIAGKRLAAGRLTVVDATNVQPEARKQLVALAREHDVLPVAIVLDAAGAGVRRAQRGPPGPGLRAAGDPPAARPAAPRAARPAAGGLPHGARAARRRGDRGRVDRPHPAVQRPARRARAVRRHRRHARLPRRARDAAGRARLRPGARRRRAGRSMPAPDGRRAVFVGDLVDRGPDTPGVLRLVMGMVAAGDALCVPGNHETQAAARAARAQRAGHPRAGRDPGAAGRRSRAEFRAGWSSSATAWSATTCSTAAGWWSSHAGLIEQYQGRASGRVRSFCLYGETTGETDEFGLPVRYPWAHDYRGRAMVLYGHTPVPEPEWVNNTMCLDTGCVFGGRLTALRYPERELVVGAGRAGVLRAGQAVPGESGTPAAAGVVRDPDVLDITDVTGRRVVETAYLAGSRVREENAAGGAGGDEPVRHRPALAALPAADDEPGRHVDPARSARAPGAGVRRLPAPRASTRWSARRSTWARARSCWSAATTAARPSGSARPATAGRGLDPHRAAVLLAGR